MLKRLRRNADAISFRRQRLNLFNQLFPIEPRVNFILPALVESADRIRGEYSGVIDAIQIKRCEARFKTVAVPVKLTLALPFLDRQLDVFNLFDKNVRIPQGDRPKPGNASVDVVQINVIDAFV